MALDDLEKRWTDLVKDITTTCKNVRNSPLDELLTEAQTVAGSLDKCLVVWEKVVKPLDSGLFKNVVTLANLSDGASKDITNFLKVSKKLDSTYPLAEELDKELDELVKAAKVFKEALKKFTKSVEN